MVPLITLRRIVLSGRIAEVVPSRLARIPDATEIDGLLLVPGSRPRTSCVSTARRQGTMLETALNHVQRVLPNRKTNSGR